MLLNIFVLAEVSESFVVQMDRLKRIVGRCSKKLHLFFDWQKYCSLTFLDLLSFRPESVIPSAGEVNMLSLLKSAR